MNRSTPLEELYWRELAAALRAMVAPGVVLAAACGAALTLTGAVAHQAAPGDGACKACQFHMSAPQGAQSPTV